MPKKPGYRWRAQVPTHRDASLGALWRRWMNRWWGITLLLWMTVLPLSAWGLRATWRQLAAHFTWAALRYGLAFDRWAALGLGLCVGLGVALLIAETRHLFWGLTRRERYQLLRALRRRRRG